ncbi:6-phosphogluconate dehydrogenase NAD-binding protein [Cyanobacterium stanieri PCC 7202]|uniref:6-phosphogluconate dehydrogenase NAD-binding protein n=1 Tax=Cyanobacterium stanieri (strain ATCC 29140 / PCC 7202) TaxID=292563 RepID=K9YNF7_CYASC|nr:6-phosphogluconate dehydrogenase NAD-binding protein [Cyanobacterium stanieri PCC 7202]
MTKVAIFGMGLMGLPMTQKLAEADITVMGYNRSAEKLEPLKEQNVPVTTDAQEAINFADCLILMLSDFSAINEVILSSDCSFAQKTVIQMGTIAPDESRQLLVEINSRGGEYLEAPVLGSIPQVKKGDLLVMVGATPQQFEQWQPLFKNYSPEPNLIGVVGQAAALKLALNQMIAGLTSTFALSLSFLEQQGVSMDIFMDILRDSALYAPTFDKKLSRMCDRTYDNPNFPSKHLLKDINLFLEATEGTKINNIALKAIQGVVKEAIAKGYEDGDYSALIEGINN